MSTLKVNTLQNASGGNSIGNVGKIIQVVSTTKCSTFTHSSTSTWTDITGMSVTITPSSSSSKILILANTRVSCNNHANARLMRGSTAIAIGDADGSRSRTSVGELYDLGNSYRSMDSSILYLDSPSTTSATTYKIQFIAGDDFYFNRTRYDNDSMGIGRPASTITVMETTV